MMSNKNLTMLTDFYEFTMANGYFEKGMGNRRAYFDMFFRRVPDGGGYAVMAGVEQLVDYFKNLHFTKEDIEYLRGRGCFSEAFLDYLKDFKFECDVWAIPEGTPIFPGEPIVTVAGPMVQAQFVETMILLTINHQTLIATKASRITRAAQGRTVLEFGSRRAQGYDGAQFVETMILLTINHQTLIATKASRITRAAQGRTVLEFGSRRAQGYDGAVYGARAAYIGGCQGTACVIADRDFRIPAGGTMAHSWVQMFDSEYEAFKAYAEIYPDNCVFLVDTYNVLKSGVPNAIRVANEVLAQMFDSEYEAFKAYAEIYPDNCVFLVDTYNVLKSGVPNAIRVANEVLAPMGIRPKGIRLDSGDIAYLSIKAREILDEAGYSDMQIMASNSLDEYLVQGT